MKKALILTFTLLLLTTISLAAKKTSAKPAKKVATIDTLSLMIKNIPTPGNKNILLATFLDDRDTIKIKEFDVFGTPSLTSYPKMLSKKDRDEKIRNYVSYQLLCKEGEKGEAIKSKDYQDLYNSSVKREAAIYLLDYLIVPRVVTADSVQNYFNAHSTKFPAGLDKESQTITDILKRKNMPKISQLADKWLDSVSIEYGIKYNENLFQRIARFNFITHGTLADSINILLSNKQLAPLIECSKIKKTFTLYELNETFKEIPPHIIASFKNINKLKSLSKGTILNEILSREADKFSLTTNPIVTAKTTTSLKSALGAIQSKIILESDKYIPTKKEMLDHYAKIFKTDKDLWCKRKMNVTEIFKPFDDTDQDSTNNQIRVAIELENTLQKIKQGEDFNQYAKLYHRKMSYEGLLYWIFKDDWGQVGEAAFLMNKGDVSELIYQPKGISIIKVTDVNEAMPYAFDFVEEIVKQKMIALKKEQTQKKLQIDLNNKYKVKFFI